MLCRVGTNPALALLTQTVLLDCAFLFGIVNINQESFQVAEKEPGELLSPKRGATNDEYFGVAKSFKHKLHEHCQDAAQFIKDDIVFLWVCVNAKGLNKGIAGKREPGVPLPLEQWLSIVDEAASLGANWLVLSIRDSLNKCANVYEISQWAQQAHGMMVGLHIKECEHLTEDAIALIKKLDREKTRVLLHCEPGKDVSLPKLKGVTVWKANPQPNGEKPKCQGPARMIFVNEKGVLYTCGLVEGNKAYRMGHVFDGRLKKIIDDPHSPRKVCDNIHVVTIGCDGCPALITNFLPKE